MSIRSNKASRIRADLESVKHPLASSMSLPADCYTDPDWYQVEQASIFRRGWVSIGRADRLQNPGNYFTLDIAGVPTIILRDREGALRAYANSCRHRGMKLLSGEGDCKAVVCPFHGWSYDLDGGLISAPRMENCVDFDHQDFGLVAFRVACSDGFAFVCLDPDQLELADWLADFGELHGPWNLSDWVSTRTREMQVDCNWKTFIEVFNEYYHLPYVHPDSIKGIYHEPDSADLVMGEFTSQFGVTRGTAALLSNSNATAFPVAPGLEGRNAQGARYTWIYPNVTFAACFDSLWMYHAYPLGPDRCHVVQTVCFPRETTELTNFDETAENYYTRIDVAVAEDLPFLEQQQVGLNSPFAMQGRFSALEPNVGNFACWYAEQMGGS